MLYRMKIVSGLLLLLFVLAGCVVPLPAQPQIMPPPATGEEATGGGQVACLESTVEQELVRNETAGYWYWMRARCAGADRGSKDSQRRA